MELSVLDDIYLIDLERGETLDCVDSKHEPQIIDEDVDEASNTKEDQRAAVFLVSIAIHNSSQATS